MVDWKANEVVFLGQDEEQVVFPLDRSNLPDH